jgi:tRNA pseudouridine38-40 synthase
MSIRTLKLTIEYDGTEFAGWQVQPEQRTVQGVLEDAFADLAGEETPVTGAGRTDAGVHALGQVAHVRTGLALPAAEVGAAVNARLTDDVRVMAIEEAADDFHARFSATSRAYFYLIGLTESPIWRRNRWLVRHRLDENLMRDGLFALAGDHDFSSFCLAGSDPDHHRCLLTGISIECESHYGGMLVLRVEANRFLRGMVRSIVGTLVEVGRGRIAPGEVPVILEAKDRGRAGPTAPPWGLYLERVSY